eukprot:12881223-Prorocentrum_lima.AAC.1
MVVSGVDDNPTICHLGPCSSILNRPILLLVLASSLQTIVLMPVPLGGASHDGTDHLAEHLSIELLASLPQVVVA